MGAPDATAGPACINGQIMAREAAVISVFDDGLLRGDGAFEFVRCYLGRPFALREHLDRLERSCALLRLSCPRAELEADVAALMAALGARNRDLRIVLTRGGERIVLLHTSAVWEQARLAFIEDEPRLILDGAKTLSYAGNMLAKRLAEERGLDEALLTRTDGRVMEVQQAAFFWVDAAGTLCTPPLSEGILDSITRRVVLAGMPVEERVCYKNDALTAAEAFVAGTSREVQPCRVIEDRVFADAPGPVTRRAIDAYWRHVEAVLGVSRAVVVAAGRQ